MPLDDVLHDDAAPMAQAPAPTKARRGFGAMAPEKQREIASKAGKAAHSAGTAHEWTPASGAAAGAKGGKSHSREHMAEIGRKGGKTRSANIAARKAAAKDAE